ncbi:hypothetical protein BJ741DRAFT_84233 [Chytriomyces cf. hyalinus JEL632]|nr:hypothetical protein BJ741DRAFT_84233 [Chytriomyces cf. hyalinus JEL632]
MLRVFGLMAFLIFCFFLSGMLIMILILSTCFVLSHCVSRWQHFSFVRVLDTTAFTYLFTRPQLYHLVRSSLKPSHVPIRMGLYLSGIYIFLFFFPFELGDHQVGLVGLKMENYNL